MKKLRAGENFGESRLFAFKHDVLYWWAPNDNRKKPRGSIRFDSRIITRPEARNPQLVYAVRYLFVFLSSTRFQPLVKGPRASFILDLVRAKVASLLRIMSLLRASSTDLI